MSTVNQEYVKDENGNIISPVVSTESIYLPNGTTVKDNVNNVYKFRKEACFYFNGGSGDSAYYPSGSYIPFKGSYYNNTLGMVVANNNGTFTIKHNGYMKVSINLWLDTTSPDARPWAAFRCYPTYDAERNIDMIDDSGTRFVSLVASNRIIPVAEGDQFGVVVSTLNSRTFCPSGGTGRNPSYITFEFLE